MNFFSLLRGRLPFSFFAIECFLRYDTRLRLLSRRSGCSSRRRGGRASDRLVLREVHQSLGEEEQARRRERERARKKVKKEDQRKKGRELQGRTTRNGR